MFITLLFYIVAFLIPVAAFILYSLDFITGEGSLASNATLSYMLNIASVALSLLTAYIALKLFAFPAVKTRLESTQKERQDNMFQTLCRIRIIAVLMVIIIDMSVWYLLGGSSSLYLGAIMLIVLLFCIPQKYVAADKPAQQSDKH